MLTDKRIQAAIKAVQTETVLNDGAAGRNTGSLVLVIRRLSDQSTSAQWFAKWKADGQRAKMRMGRYPGMTLLAARQRFANEISPLIQAGRDPRVAPVSGGKPTVGRMFQAYVDDMRSKGRESADEVERVLLRAKANAADALGRHRLAGDVVDDDVVAYVSKFYRRGKRGAADKARSYIVAAYTWAKKSANDYTVENRQNWGIKNNPGADVPKDMGAVGTRDRNLSASELRTLWHAATPGSNGFTLESAGCIRLLIGAGQRVQETLRLDGRDLDLDEALWNMPAHKTKGRKRPHTIPLPHQVIPILRDLVAVHGNGPLFPARSDSKRDHMDHRSIMQAIDRWLDLDGVKVAAFQTRDIRRTWKSRAGEAGISKEMRDLIQQHAKTDTGSKNYDRADYLPPMRAAMDVWAAWLDKVLAADDGEQQIAA